MRFGWKALIGLLVAGCAAVSPTGAAASSPDAWPATEPDTSSVTAQALTPDVRYLLQWALETGDPHHQPFAVVDKRSARIFVFDAKGELVGAAPVLLGQAVGDHTLPSVSDEEVSQLALANRTTPAGRFASQPGRNLSGEAIVWFDYAAALAIHRVRPGATHARRLASLTTATPADKRASLGCVVVSPAFYETVLQPTLGQRRGVVYVLPERQPVQAMFGRPQPVAHAP